MMYPLQNGKSVEAEYAPYLTAAVDLWKSTNGLQKRKDADKTKLKPFVVSTSN